MTSNGSSVAGFIALMDDGPARGDSSASGEDAIAMILGDIRVQGVQLCLNESKVDQAESDPKLRGLHSIR